jgi:uncharacterized membrane protein
VVAAIMILCSGMILGLWDVCKKICLKKNSVLVVLSLYSVFCLLIVSFELPNAINISSNNLLVILIKSIFVYVSWTMSFIALKKLPISIIAPFDSMNPVFSILLGIIVLNERLGYVQLLGIAIMLVSYYFISKVGNIEIGNIFKNKYFYFMIIAAFLSAVSALIDKVALRSINSGMLQFWFSLFMAVLYNITLMIYKFGFKKNLNFKFDYNIIIMSILLVLADRIYFNALNIPSTQISIAMPLRKISILISVMIGGALFKEGNLRKKFVCTILLILGIIILFI